MVQLSELLRYCEQYQELPSMYETEGYKEFVTNDPVARNIKYVRFVSKSKGRRNGKQRLRRKWKEVHLVHYNNGFHSWHLFPFDVYATEIIGQFADGEMLRQRIIDLWGY